MAYQPIQMPGGGAPQPDLYGFAKDQVARKDALRQQAMNNWLSVWKQSREDQAEERRMAILEEQQRATKEKEDWAKKKEFSSIQSEIMPMLANPATAAIAKARLQALGISLDQIEVPPPPTATQQVGVDIQAGKVVDPFAPDVRKPEPPAPLAPPVPPAAPAQAPASDYLAGAVDPLDAAIAENLTQGQYYGPRDTAERGVGIDRSGFKQFARKFGFSQDELARTRDNVMAPVKTPEALEAIARENAARAQAASEKARYDQEKADFDRVSAEQARGLYRLPNGEEGPAVDQYNGQMGPYKDQLRQYLNQASAPPRSEYRMQGLGIDSTISEDAIQQGVDQQRRGDAQRFGDAFATIAQHHPRGAEASQWIPVLQAEVQAGMPLKNANDALNRFLAGGDGLELRQQLAAWRMDPQRQREALERARAGRMVVSPGQQQTLDLNNEKYLWSIVDKTAAATKGMAASAREFGRMASALEAKSDDEFVNSAREMVTKIMARHEWFGSAVTQYESAAFNDIGGKIAGLQNSLAQMTSGTMNPDVKRGFAQAIRDMAVGYDVAIGEIATGARDWAASSPIQGVSSQSQRVYDAIVGRRGDKAAVPAPKTAAPAAPAAPGKAAGKNLAGKAGGMDAKAAWERYKNRGGAK